ncbi:MAG: MFS transporter [Chloroflexota bacterium]|nr:MFS transporter [Chloroflexota bacterium]
MAQTTTKDHEESPTTGIRYSRLVNELPIYYGWVIVVASVIGRVMTSPGQTYTISIFIEHFIADLGISRSLASTLYTIGTLAGGLSLPFVGQQLDKRGPRVMAGVITVLFTLACIYMGFVQGPIMLGFGFVLLRMLGQGSLSMISSNVINRWWVRRRGTVLGIAGVLSSVLGSGLFPSLVYALIGRFGWRSTYPLLGLLVAVVMLPVGLLLYRSQPEDYGLEPDGGMADKDKRGRDEQAAEENWTRAEAVRTAAFWSAGLGLAAISMLGTGLQFHMVSIFRDSGLPEGAAAAAFLPIAVTVGIVNLTSGMLVDRIPVRFLLCVALLLQATSLVMAPRLQGRTMASIYGVVMGMTTGLQFTVSTVIWATYYGRRHLGSIRGAASLVTIGGSALGPMPMGVARDLLGSYDLALTVAAALPLALALLALTVRRPTREEPVAAGAS